MPSWPAGERAILPCAPARSPALRALLAPADVTCALAVSHGSASKQFLAAVLPDERDVPQALPNCAIMACDHDEASGEFFVRDIIDPCA